MRAYLSSLWLLGSVAIGAAVFVVIMRYLASAHAFQWRTAAKAYSGRTTATALASKWPETIVVAERGGRVMTQGGWRLYPGVRIQVHDDGLALSLVSPLNIMCPPLFLPFVEMEVAPTWWGLWPEPQAIRMKQAPKVDIILGEDTVRWLREHCENGPFGRAES